MSRKNRTKKTIGKLRKGLNKAIIIFDEDPTEEFSRLREIVLPNLLNKYCSRGVLKQSKVNSLKSMLASVDRADWYIAFCLIQKMKKYY